MTGLDAAARYGYLAEITARECLGFVLQKQLQFVHFKDRDTLQDAWTKPAAVTYLLDRRAARCCCA